MRRPAVRTNPGSAIPSPPSRPPGSTAGRSASSGNLRSFYWPTQLTADNAHRRGSRLTIHYRFHPHFGETVFFWRREASAAAVQFAAHPSSGLPLPVADWMTCPEAALLPLVGRPRISVPALAELGGIVSAFLRSADGEGGSDGMECPAEEPVRSGGLGLRSGGGRRVRLILLAVKMIRQAAGSSDPEGKEGGDEQDHVRAPFPGHNSICALTGTFPKQYIEDGRPLKLTFRDPRRPAHRSSPRPPAGPSDRPAVRHAPRTRSRNPEPRLQALLPLQKCQQGLCVAT